MDHIFGHNRFPNVWLYQESKDEKTLLRLQFPYPLSFDEIKQSYFSPPFDNLYRFLIFLILHFWLSLKLWLGVKYPKRIDSEEPSM